MLRKTTIQGETSQNVSTLPIEKTSRPSLPTKSRVGGSDSGHTESVVFGRFRCQCLRSDPDNGLKSVVGKRNLICQFHVGCIRPQNCSSSIRICEIVRVLSESDVSSLGDFKPI